ncbi:MAG: disulfide bond formation protein B [Thalassovita sp.]
MNSIFNFRAMTGLATSGSTGLLGGAFFFQFLGFAPCAMCLWQRWPHGAAILIGVLALILGLRSLAWLGAIAAAITAGLGYYHTGVERDWWEGPTSCTGTGGLDPNNLLSMDGPALVMCDQVSWEFLTLSMATWNGLFSTCLVVIWILAARAKA